MLIEDNLLSIFKVFFKDRQNWRFVTDKQKQDYFFIFNRYLSKKYLKQAKLLNNKNIDKVSAMNIWFNFLKNEPYPNWFWSKSTEKKEKEILTKSEYNELLKTFNIKSYDMDFLINEHPDFIKEEVDRIKKIQKQN